MQFTEQLETLSEVELQKLELPTPQTEEDLFDCIKALAKRPHDYWTSCYAVSIASTLVFNYMAHKLGITGFQASHADLDIIRRIRRLKCPFALIKADDLCYPQYNLLGRVQELIKEWYPWTREKCIKLLESHGDSASFSVIQHWKNIIEKTEEQRKVGTTSDYLKEGTCWGWKCPTCGGGNAPQSKQESTPKFQIGDIVRLNWETSDNNVAKVVYGLPGTSLSNIWFVKSGHNQPCSWTIPGNLTLLANSTPLCKELDGISVGDIVIIKELGGPDLYREVVLIDPSHSHPYGIYIPAEYRCSSVVCWLKKEDIIKILKFPKEVKVEVDSNRAALLLEESIGYLEKIVNRDPEIPYKRIQAFMDRATGFLLED